MKKKILGVGIILVLIIMLLNLTGCGNDNNNKTETQQENLSDTVKNNENTNNSNEINSGIEISNSGELTLENFKKIMQEMNLEVRSDTPEGVNSANHLYTVYDDNNSIRYTFNEYKNEEIARNQWNANVKNRFTGEQEIRNEEDENSSRLEIKVADRGTYIDFREGKNVLNVAISIDAGENAVAKAKEVFEKLGY